MSDLSGKRLLILGGSYCKDAIKQFATEHEVRLIAAGNSPTAGISLIADEYYNVNSTDPIIMKELIKEKNIDGVYLGSSEPVINAAISYVSECGFPCYCTKNQWEVLQNKGALKELFMQFGLPVVPRYKITYEQIDAVADAIDFPVITKPADGCGSSGFTQCNTVEELKKGYRIAAENSVSGEVMIEKFVKNRGVVAFFSFSKGEMIFLGMEDKYPRIYQQDGSYVAGLLVFESRFTREFSKRFGDKLRKLFAHLDLQEGTVWMEVFKDGDDYYFNEAGYRYGGSVTVYPIDYLYGVNQVYADMHYALTGESVLYGHSSLVGTCIPQKKYYCIYPVYIKAGIIKTIHGVHELEGTVDVVKVIMTKSVGNEVTYTGGFSQNVALVHFVCDDDRQLETMIQHIHETIKIIDNEGHNMLTTPLDIKSAGVIM